MQTAAAIAVEVNVDLGPMNVGLSQTDAKVRAFADRSVGNFNKVEDAARKAAGAGSAELSRFSAANDNAGRSMERLAALARNASSSLSTYGGALNGAALAGAAFGVAIVGAARAVASAGDTYTRYANQLQAAGVASTALAGTQRDLTAMAIATRTSLDATVAIYARMTRATGELGVSQAQVGRFVEVLNKDLANSGISAGEAAGGILQFSQAMQSGALNGDELRSVLETMPTIAKAIAREFKVSVGELRSLGAEGALTADRVFRAVINAGREVDAAFAKTTPTIAQGVEAAKTGIIALAAEIDRSAGLSKAFAVSMQAIGEKASEAAQGVDRLRLANENLRVTNLQETLAGLRSSELPNALQLSIPGRANPELDRVNALIAETERQLSASFRAIEDRIQGMVGLPERALRPMSDELMAMVPAADSASRAIGATGAAADSAGNSMANAAVKARGFADALRSIQAANPNLGPALGLLGKVEEVNKSLAEGTKGIIKSFNEGEIGDSEAQSRIKKLQDETLAARKALREEFERPFADYGRKAEIAGMDDLGKALARNADEFEAHRKKAEENYRVLIERAESPAARGALEAERDKVINKLAADTEKLNAAERKLNAERNAKSGGGSAASAGTDAYDNAIARIRDQIEELKLQQEAASKTTVEIYKLTEANRLRRAANQAGRGDERGIAEDIERTAEAYARQRKATEDAIEAQRRYQESVRDTAEGISDFVKDLVGGKGLDAALKSFGSRLIEQALDGLLTGKGAIGNALGLAPTTKGGTGGLIGALLGQDTGFFSKMTKAVESGSSEGVFSGFGSLFGVGKPLQGPTQSGATLDAGGFGGMGGVALGGLGGAVAGYSSGSPIMGAVSGALMGFSAAGPAGAVVGAIAGVIGGVVGGNSQDKKRREELRRQAEENYQQAAPQIASLGSQLRGDPQNTLKMQIAEAEAAQKKLGDIAYLSGRVEEQNKLYLDFQTYSARVLGEFRDGFIGMIQSMEAGLGPNSPFAQAKSAVADFGKELQGFIENAETAFGQGTPQVDQARQASIAYAVSVLDGAKSLTLVQQRMQEIQGTGAGLVKVLVDLGVASEQAGEAVSAGVAMAVQRLRDTFETDLQAKTNEALDKGYLNDARSLLLEIQQLATDSRTLGTDPGNITRYFQAAAQNLVDEANLTGDAFEEFLRLFPEFTGNVVAAGQALEDASRRLGYLDRLFNATNDTSTLAGQLAAYDRQAMREREEEIRLGGQYILELEAAQQAERYNIIRDFNKAANDNYRQSLQQAQDYVARFTRSIQEYLDGLRAGSDSPLSPQARLAAAQSQYNAQLALAQGGDRNALDGITSYASDLLDAAKGFFASSTGFQDIFAQIQSQLGALPSQISAEQFIVNAIEAGAANTVSAISVMQGDLRSVVQSNNPIAIGNALSGYFGQLDTSLDGLLTPAEFVAGLGPLATSAEQAAARAIFTSIDQNGDGMISAIEAMSYSLVSAVQANNATAFASALNANFNKLDTSVSGLLSYNQIVAALGPMATRQEQEWARGVLNSIDLDGNGQIDKMEAVRAATSSSDNRIATSNAHLAQLQHVLFNQITENTAGTAYQVVGVRDQLIGTNSRLADTNWWLSQVTDRTDRTRANLKSQNDDRYITTPAQRAPIASYATGGWVSGPGTGTSDSIAARLSNGEFVMREAAASRFGSVLDYMNDNLRLPPMPANAVPIATGGGDGAMLAELKALRASNERLERQVTALTQSNADGHKRTAAAVDENTGAVKADTKTSRRGQAPAGRAAA